jgi:hypothetical protein
MWRCPAAEAWWALGLPWLVADFDLAQNAGMFWDTRTGLAGYMAVVAQL